MEEAKCFCGLGQMGRELAVLALLCKWLKVLDPMAQCDVNSLMQDAKCFGCLTPDQRETLIVQLLCEILTAGGGSGNSCLTCGAFDPVDPPTCECAIHYNTTTGSMWVWDDVAMLWRPFAL